MSKTEFAPGDWVQSIYGTIGIVASHDDCDLSDDYVHGRHAYGTASAPADSPFHCRKGFCSKVAPGTVQPIECMDPFYWASMM